MILGFVWPNEIRLRKYKGEEKGIARGMKFWKELQPGNKNKEGTQSKTASKNAFAITVVLENGFKKYIY